MKTEIWAMGLVVIGTLIGSWGALLLKMGANSFKFRIKKLISNYKIIFGIFLYVLSSIFYIYALKRGQLTVLYPLCSLSYIWVSILSIKFLKEEMNRLKTIGIGFIIIGIILIGLGNY